MTSFFLEKFKRNSFLLVLLFISTLFYSCIPYPGNIDEAEDSGFGIDILNYSDRSYTGCILYVGAINENDKFIALDSLVYPNLYIKNRNEDTKIDGFDGIKYGLTQPFQENSQNLTKFNTWASPTRAKIESISPKGEISFKLSLNEGNTGVFETFKFSILDINAVISEDGSIK